MPNKQNDLILEAITSAERSLVLAKKLLGGVQTEGPGLLGKFDGEFMVTEAGKRFQVSPNYASKSMLVVGDVLRMVGRGEQALFKQVEKIARLEANGVLTKKDGVWAVVTEQGSFSVLPAAVKFHQGEIGDEVEVLMPKEYKRLKARWVALVQVEREEAKKDFGKEVQEDEKPKESKVSPKESVKEGVEKKEAKKEATVVKEEEKKVVRPVKPKTTVAKKAAKPPLEKETTAVREVSAKPGAAQEESRVRKEAAVKMGTTVKKEEEKMTIAARDKLKGEIKIDEEELR